MKFLKREIRPQEPAPTGDAQRIVHREIEISVEREWISVTAGTTADGIAQKPESGQFQPELTLPTGLPPPKPE